MLLRSLRSNISICGTEFEQAEVYNSFMVQLKQEKTVKKLTEKQLVLMAEHKERNSSWLEAHDQIMCKNGGMPDSITSQ